MTRFLKDKTTYETTLRYVLGLVMLSYGLIKVLRARFVIILAPAWATSSCDFMGANKPYLLF